MEKFGSWTRTSPKSSDPTVKETYEESKKQPVPSELWSFAPFFAAVRKHAIAEITKCATDLGAEGDALTKFWPMTLRNDKAVILAALTRAKDKKGILELAGQRLQLDPDIQRAAGMKAPGDRSDDLEDPEEDRGPTAV